MAKDNVKAFFEALSKDEALAKALQAKEAAYTGNKEDREAAVAAIVLPVAAEAGYSFTLDELKEYEKELSEKNGELTDDEMAAVSGGDLRDSEGYGVCVFLGVGLGAGCVLIGGGFCAAYGAMPKTGCLVFGSV